MSNAGDNQDQDTDWELLSEFARRRNELDPIFLRGLLARALRRRGFAALVWPEDSATGEPATGRGSALMAWIVIWSLGIAATDALGLPWFLAPVGVLGVAMGSALLFKLVRGSASGAGVLILGWLVVGVATAVEGPFLVFFIAYLLPLGLGLAYALANRLLRLRDAQDVAMALGGVARSAPLVAPVVLIVLFLPALSSDVWRVAGELDVGSLLLAGLLSVGLLFVVVRLQLGSQVTPMIAQRAEHLSDQRTRLQLTRRQVALASNESDTEVLDELDDETLDAAWPAAGEEYAPYLQTAVGSTLQAPLTGRLAVTISAVGLLLSAYIYLLCSAVIRIDRAEAWSGVDTPAATVDILGLSCSFPGGPYLYLAALLGLAATATFLSFALVEERFAQALTDALLRDPTDRFLALALPYVKLSEDAIEAGRRRQLATDPAPSPSAEDS